MSAAVCCLAVSSADSASTAWRDGPPYRGAHAEDVRVVDRTVGSTAPSSGIAGRWLRNHWLCNHARAMDAALVVGHAHGDATGQPSLRSSSFLRPSFPILVLISLFSSRVSLPHLSPTAPPYPTSTRTSRTQACSARPTWQAARRLSAPAPLPPPSLPHWHCEQQEHVLPLLPVPQTRGSPAVSTAVPHQHGSFLRSGAQQAGERPG